MTLHDKRCLNACVFDILQDNFAGDIKYPFSFNFTVHSAHRVIKDTH